MVIQDKETLRNEIRAAMRKTGALDLWTELSASDLLGENSPSVDALIADDRGLLDQARTFGIELPQDTGQRAEALFQALFVERSPLGDAQMRLLLTLERMGMQLGMRDLSTLREQLGTKSADGRLDLVLDQAKLRGVTCLVDPFAEDAAAVMERFLHADLSPKLLPVLSVESLQKALEDDAPLVATGAQIERDPRGAHVARIAEVLMQCAATVGARMVRASEPGDSMEQQMLMRYAVLSLCEEGNLPLMFVLPTGDAEADGMLGKIEALLASTTKLRLVLVARGAKSDQLLRMHSPLVCDRVYVVHAAAIGETIGAFGSLAMPYASGARVLEQTIGDWVEARREISQALYDRYLPLVKMGWGVRQSEIEADVAEMLGGNWERFCKTDDQYIGQAREQYE